ncbi:MAG: BON domain-containing protein [Candidatus Zixiibacteriota bacterium]
MKFKTLYSLTLVMATALFIMSVPIHASDVDDRMESSLKKSYVFKTYLHDDDIKVKCENGVVTMTGSVVSESHRSMAEETAMSVEGVKSVNNQLTINGAQAAANSDAWITERVKNTLLFHRSVSYANTDVTVKDGEVILRGTASSEAQKELLTEYTKDVSGVKEVDNKMTISKTAIKSQPTTGDRIDDASITTQVRMSLLFHHGTDAFDTKVTTNDGVVTLTGTARNQAEIDLATKRSNDVQGVRSVINKMTIEAPRSSND